MIAIDSAYEIHIKGLVQGVGFRPFIYRVATRNGLKGWVENRNDGVMVKIDADQQTVDHFVQEIKEKAPFASAIRSVDIREVHVASSEDFQIRDSENVSSQVTEISPDIAVCYDCLEDMKMQPHRINYPFINCTHCGPRFSIIKTLPYDRKNTTMHEFGMCRDCQEEYENVNNRRFHAQPVACNFCGPQYEFFQEGRVIRDTYKILKELKRMLYRGKIIAIKGMGGFHLVCDATNERTVRRLREIKMRDRKPFAVMFSDLEVLKEYTHVSEEEKEMLLSWRRPVVLLKQKKRLAESVNSQLNELGVLFPYMPLHFLLFEEIDLPALVFTSANLKEEPILADNRKAQHKLEHLVDAFLFHNRDIYNRSDDSVVRIVGGNPQIIRRSRGYVPSPVDLTFDASGIIATGAELKSTFTLGMGKQAIVSQHIGDLKSYETYDFYTSTMKRFQELFRHSSHLIVSDLHPDYLSTKLARQFQSRSMTDAQYSWIQVQHHHAHIASCMAENGLEGEVIGIALDGTGLGDDGKIWGGEIMKCSYSTYERMAHFKYIPMPGGDKAVKFPWRMALAYLSDSFIYEDQFSGLGFIKDYPREDVKLILSMIRKGLNSPLTSSAGRLFDAVSALLSECRESCFEAEAPMRLEALVIPGIEEIYPFEFSRQTILSFQSTFHAIVEDLDKGVSREEIATKFHNTVARAVVTSARSIRENYHIHQVALSGGTFQNRYLTEKTVELLEKEQFNVYVNRLVPANDGGISLGQLAIAAHKK